MTDAVFEAGILLRADGADLHLVEFDEVNARVIDKSESKADFVVTLR